MVAAAYFAIFVVWGSTFLAIRLAIESIPPLLMMGVRCTIAGLLLLGAAAFRREWPAARDWRAGVAAGAVMFGLPYAAIGWAELRISSGMAALLVATLPLWLVAIEWARSSRPSTRTLTGLAIGLAGVIVLVIGGLRVPSSIAPMLAVVGGELAWAVGSIYLQPRLPKAVALNAGMPLASGGVLLLVAAALLGEARAFDLHAVTARSMLALGYLIVFGSIVAFSAYVFLLRRAPASRVSTHTYVNPLIAVALGVAAAGEPITTSMIVATVVIAAGVALVLSGKHSPHRPTFSVSRPSNFAYGRTAPRSASRA